MLKRKTDSEESKEYWEFADKMLERVESYPVWKKGGEDAQSDVENKHSCKTTANNEDKQTLKLI